MVLTFDEAARLLDDITDSFPEELFQHLNGGVLLIPEAEYHPDAPDLLTLGVYCHDMMGRYIKIFYGSMVQLAQEENWTQEDWEGGLWDTLSHELTHHLEGLAGERALEIKDEVQMAEYWESKRQEE